MQHPALNATYRLGPALKPPIARADRTKLALLLSVAVLAGLGLLALFQSVLHEAVRQGQLRREATARHSAATWRCTGLRSMRQRDQCLAELNAPPPQVTLLTTP